MMLKKILDVSRTLYLFDRHIGFIKVNNTSFCFNQRIITFDMSSNISNSSVLRVYKH